MPRDSVTLDQKCHQCGRNHWGSYTGYLRCDCGQIAWIKRNQDSAGTHFSIHQGQELPSGYRGWATETR